MIGAQDKNDRTPLHYAAWSNQLDAARLLVDVGANIGAKDKDGKTPLDIASELGKTEVANFLSAKRDEALFTAVESGNVNEVTSLLNEGVSIEAKGINNETPLCVASRTGKLDVLQLLLSRNANVNVQDDDGKTPLHHAAWSGQLDAVRLLVDRGANIGAKDKDGKTPLDIANEFDKFETLRLLINKAIEQGKLDLVKSFLKSSAKETEIKDENESKTNWTLLHYAAYNGRLDVVQDIFKLPVEKRGDINHAEDHYGWTPLHYAVYYNRNDVARFLINQGANIKAVDKEGRTPLDVANSPDKSEIANFLRVKQSEYNNLLFTAVESGNVSEVTNLLNKGANIEAKGVKNETPLCVASRTGKLDVLQLLLSRNANVNIQDGDGKTPLHHAAYIGTGVELILGKGSSIEAKDKNGWMPLHYAAWQGQLNVARALVARGANIGARGKDGKTPLDVANTYRKLEIANFLTQKQSEYDNKLLAAVGSGGVSEVTNLLNIGANIEAKGAKDETPLCVASRTSREGMLELLLSRDASVRVQDDDRRTPLHHAAYFGKGVELILSKGANIEAEDKDGCTPLNYAAWQGQLEAARFLVDKGANINDTCSPDRRKPIHIAAMEGHKNVIEFFISKGINVNDVATGNGWTPLHYAAWKGKSDAVKTLVAKGANIGAKDKDDKTPLDVANTYRKSEIANFLTQKQSEYDNRLLTAAERGNVSEVTNLLDIGANIEAKGRNGWTPLNYALSKGHLSTVELLLDRKANIEAKVEHGWTPLLYAIRYSSKDMIQLLIRRGANTSAKDIKNQTVARGAMLASRSSDILDLVWHSSGDGDGWYYQFHYRPGKSKREVYTPSVDKQISLESIGARNRRSIAKEDEDSLQNDEIDYTKGGAASGASRPSSWINGLCGWEKEKSGELISGLYGDADKKLEDSRYEDVQASSNNQQKSKHPNYDRAKEMDFQYMSKYDARKSNDKNIGAHSKKRGNGEQSRQQYESKISNKQNVISNSVNQSRIISNEKHQWSETFHGRPKPTLSYHGDKKHSCYDGQPKKISERKEHTVNHKQFDNNFHKHGSKPMIDTNNRWSERISNEKMDNRKMIGNIDQKQQNFHSSKHAPLTRATAQVDVPGTLFALNMWAMKVTNQKFNKPRLPKKIQKGIL